MLLLRGAGFVCSYSNVCVGGFWLLGELWSSILSSCLMEQEALVDNVKGCEGVGGCFCVRLGEQEGSSGITP